MDRRTLLYGTTVSLAAAAAGRAEEGKKMELRHDYATVNGVKLHYAVAGQGKTILFLHGFPEFWYAWKNQLAEFGKDHQAVAVDLRGYNLSDKPVKVEEYAIPLLVADVKALIDRLSPDRKVILVGHDWGGVLAWVTAMQHPDRLEKLVIVNAPHPALFQRELANNPEQQKASSYMNLFRSPNAEGVLSAGDYAAMAVGVFGSARPGAFSDEDKKAYLEAWSRPGALTGGLNYYRASGIGPPNAGAAAPAAPPLPSAPVKVPTLVLWGEKDTALLPGNLEGLDKVVESVKVVRIPEGTHWVVHEEPERVNREIRAFVGK